MGFPAGGHNNSGAEQQPSLVSPWEAADNTGEKGHSRRQRRQVRPHCATYSEQPPFLVKWLATMTDMRLLKPQPEGKYIIEGEGEKEALKFYEFPFMN